MNDPTDEEVAQVSQSAPTTSEDALVREVVEVLTTTLGIEDQRPDLDAHTELLGELPELDSLGVVELVVALEGRFGIEIDDADLTGEVFETVGTLAAFVASLGASPGVSPEASLRGAETP